jgi:hypothetical protein
LRFAYGQWSTPYPLHRDNWEIKACPVEGPSLAASGKFVAAAWITRAGGVSRLQFAFSTDDGRSFSPPATVDDGNPIGRPHLIAIDQRSFALSWIERHGEQAAIRLRRLSPGAPLASSLTATAVPAGRAAGIPKIALHRGEIFLAWRQDAVQVLRIPLPALPVS